MFRAAATSIANWAEEQGGIPLFTIEGDCSLGSPYPVSLCSFAHSMYVKCASQQARQHCAYEQTALKSHDVALHPGEEPDSPTASWNLPALSKHTSIANAATAESLSDDRARTISEGWKQYAL